MNQTLVFEPAFQQQKNLVRTLYVLHALSFLFSLGAFSWIPVIINFVKRGEVSETFLYSHHSWQIRSFFWYLVWMVLGFFFFISIIGFFVAFIIWGAAWIWKAYRLIKGFADLNANKPMPL